MDANLTTSKTAIDAISSKSGDFNKMVEKNPLVKAFSPILDDFQIFAKELLSFTTGQRRKMMARLTILYGQLFSR